MKANLVNIVLDIILLFVCPMAAIIGMGGGACPKFNIMLTE